MSRRGTARAFTLLEVMIALALLAGAMVALAELAGQALRNHGYARDLSVATLLARGKMAELEQQYEDAGFRDFDETEDGDFRDEGWPAFRWKVEVVRPDPSLSPEALVGQLAGAEGDPAGLVQQLLGGGGEPDENGQTTTSPAAGLTAGFLQTQLTAFSETLKKSVRELRLTVSWQDGKVPRDVTVTTHLVVLNPRAPGGARGNDPDVPPNLTATPATGTQGSGQAGGAGQRTGTSPAPGTTGTGTR